MSIAICPKCMCQLEVKLTFASGAVKVPNRDDVGELLQQVNSEALDDYEREFIEKTRARYETYHESIKLTDKQMALLRKIADKSF